MVVRKSRSEDQKREREYCILAIEGALKLHDLNLSSWMRVERSWRRASVELPRLKQSSG